MIYKFCICSLFSIMFSGKSWQVNLSKNCLLFLFSTLVRTHVEKYKSIVWFFNLKRVLNWQFVTYIFSVSLKFRASYITGWWGELREKNVTLCVHILSWHFVVVFYQKNCVFIIINSFFDKVSNFHNRILTNQKPVEFAIRNCQWNLFKILS